MREYSHEIIQPRKWSHHIEKEQQSQELAEAKKLKKKLKNKKRKQNRLSKIRAPQEALEEAKIDEAPGSGSEQLEEFAIIQAKQEEVKQSCSSQKLEQLSDSPKSEQPSHEEVIKPRNQRK
jgi:hypothetical protein